MIRPWPCFPEPKFSKRMQALPDFAAGSTKVTFPGASWKP